MTVKVAAIRLKYDGTVVYRVYSEDGRLLYVGMTNSLFVRMAQHLNSAVWWQCAAKLHVEEFATRAEAEVRERELIRESEPPFNVVHQSPRKLAQIRKIDNEAECANTWCNGWAAEDSDLCPRCILTDDEKTHKLTAWQRHNYKAQNREHNAVADAASLLGGER